MAIKPAATYMPALLAQLQVPPTSPHANMYLAILTAVQLMLLDVDVSPLPSMASVSGTTGGPVLGLGKLL